MKDHLELKHIETDTFHISLFVPEPARVQHVYYQLKEESEQMVFPYWAKLWPSAMAMAEFLQTNVHYVQGKKILELAAGLGLPSLLVAAHAISVVCSDYVPEAVAVVQQSVEHNQLTNVTCRVIDWHHLPGDLTAEVLLLSDINYDPIEFEVLFTILQRFIHSGTMIILSTPQRLMAKSFIERLLPWRVRQEEMIVEEQMISILVLQRELLAAGF